MFGLPTVKCSTIIVHFHCFLPHCHYHLDTLLTPCTQHFIFLFIHDNLSSHTHCFVPSNSFAYKHSIYASKPTSPYACSPH